MTTARTQVYEIAWVDLDTTTQGYVLRWHDAPDAQDLAWMDDDDLDEIVMQAVKAKAEKFGVDVMNVLGGYVAKMQGVMFAAEYPEDNEQS